MRERVGVIDLTPFTKYEVTGPGAEAWLDGWWRTRCRRRSAALRCATR